MSDENVRILGQEIISDNYFPLKKVTFEQRRRDGSTQTLTRELYDSASGAAVLLYDRAHRSVVLTRQFRLGAHLAGHDGYLLEAAAGMLDDTEPAQRVRAEALEETGYDIDRLQRVMTMFASPGVTTEQVHLFIGEIVRGERADTGGGLREEGEDIEVVEMDFDDALAMIDTGAIADAKTIILLLHLERKVLGRHGEAS
jgi:nudix-type nucleoside diphosphatase (YffH/AdpP family)